MTSLFFNEIHGYCYVAKKYQLVSRDYVLFIENAIDDQDSMEFDDEGEHFKIVGHKRVDALLDADQLMYDFLDTANALASCPELKQYMCAWKKWSYSFYENHQFAHIYEDHLDDPVRSCDVFTAYHYIDKCGDVFLGSSDDLMAAKSILFNFLCKYGLPRLDETYGFPFIDTMPRLLSKNGECLSVIALMFMRELEVFTDEKPYFFPEYNNQIKFRIEHSGNRIIVKGFIETVLLDEPEYYKKYYSKSQEKRTFIINSDGPMPTLAMADIWSCLHVAYIHTVLNGKVQIKKCKACGNIFSSENKRSEFCSSSCRSRYSVAKYRSQKKDNKASRS